MIRYAVPPAAPPAAPRRGRRPGGRIADGRRPCSTPAGSPRGSAGGGTAPSSRWPTAAFRLTLEGRHEMVDLVIEPRADRRRAGPASSSRSGSARWARPAPASSSSTATATTPMVATNADGMTALLRRVPMESPERGGAAQRPARAGRRRPGVRGRAARRPASCSPAHARPPRDALHGRARCGGRLPRHGRSLRRGGR